MLYSFGGNTGETAESIARKRDLAKGLLAAAPRAPRDLGQGLHSFGSQIAAALISRQANKADDKARAAANERFADILGALGGQAQPAPAAPAPAPATYQPEQFRDAIASIESAGSGDYSAVGPETGKGRAYGRYQVMDFNIPQWTREVLGQEMTPQQFLADAGAQDRVFDAKFGGYLDEHGTPEDAASMWFSGRPMAEAGQASDGYTTVPEYIGKFQTALGAPQAPDGAQLAQAAPRQSALDPRLLGALSDPYMTDGQKLVAQMLLQQQLQASQPMDPATAQRLDMERQRLAETQRMNDAKLSGVYNPGTTVSINNAGESAFAKEAGKGLASSFVGMMETGTNATAELGQIEELRRLVEREGVGGTSDAWQLWAQNALGINTGVGSAVEAFDALVNKLVPQQRPPGSGQMSDRDVQLFMQSLPQLVNTPGGNQLILDTMQAMTQFKQQTGRIASQALTGQISKEDAISAMQALPDPLASFREQRGDLGNAAPAAASETTPATAGGIPPAPTDYEGITEENWPAIWEAMPPEDKALWQN